jgi:hypothetical protein
MHTLLFDIVPLHNDALLVSFNERLYPFEEEASRLLTKPCLHRLLDITMRAEPVLHVLMWVIHLLWSSIHPLDVLVRSWCRWATRSAFICYTCSTLLKAVYPLVYLSLMHGACSILCQHLAMDFCRFNPLCPQKLHYGMLFLDGAITEWSGHTSTLVTLYHVTE